MLRSDARLDPIGLLAMTGAATMMGVATVLTKRWGRPPGMSSLGMTGWTFLLAGLTLLPITLIVEGLPPELTARNVGGLVYLVLISGILAYALWFWGLAVPDRQRGDLPLAAQSCGRGRARLGGAGTSDSTPWQTARRADRADLGGARSARRVRAAAPRPPRRSPLASGVVSGADPDRRWPRQVYAVGTEPDPRFTFANERTFLAWIRTALGFLAAGVAIAAVARLSGRAGVRRYARRRSC